MPDHRGGPHPTKPAVVINTGQQSSGKGRVIRVFVSSTFRDMIEDRNELMAQVWPALRKVCRGRAVEFVEVDLRWGVTEEQAQRKETVRHCLAEIKRCRPYFIGLLGERYGWVPGPEAYSPALLDEEKWLADQIVKHSVTELEILHGVLNDPDIAGRAFFYFRDPKYAQTRGGDFLPEESDERTRQDSLKLQVRVVCEAKHIPLREDYPDPQALGKLVLKDLTAAIEAEFPHDQVPDVWAREDRDHEAYANSRRTEFYVGRNTYFEQLNSYTREGADGCGLTVLGASGGGKSALLANWVACCRQANPNDFVFQHYIGSSPVSAGHLPLMRRLMMAIIRFCRDENRDAGESYEFELEEEKPPVHAEEVVKAFPGYLDRLAVRAKQKGVRAIVVLDALNQLEDRERGRLLAWLPNRLPIDLRWIVSTLPGDTLQALQSRAWPELTVEPLEPKERVALIARYLSHFSQALSKTRTRKIASVQAASNPLYIKTLLDDLRATGAHDQLDAQIDDYLRAPDISALFGTILTRYERDYERDRPGLVGEALSLLWAARRGLTEPELLEILKPTGGESLPSALWSPVRCALEDSLVDRDGVLAFAHEHLRVAVDCRYLPAPSTAQTLRLRLADHFAERPLDARQADEFPWLLRQAESRDRLRACLLDIDRFLLIQDRDEEELRGYWVWLGEERDMDRSYVRAFEAWAQAKEESAAVSATANYVVVFLLGAALYKGTEPLVRRALRIDTQIYGESHPRVAIGLNNLAQLLQATNRHTEAEPLMRRALEIDEQSYGESHPDVARNLNNLAQLLKDTNRLVDAEPLMRRALQIVEHNYGENHPKVARDLNILAGLLHDTNRLAEAEALMRRALKISEQSYGENHPDVAVGLSILAQLLHDTNRLAEAEALIRRALKIDEQSYGENHPNVAICLNNLAQLLHDTNRLAEAEALMRRALKIDEQSYGENHPNVAIRLNNLAALLHATNRFGEAEPLMRRALKIDEQSYGESHPDVARNLSNLAELLQDTNRFAEAEPLMRRALKIREASLGSEHPKVAICLNNLAQLLKNANRFAEAEPLMRRALEIDERSYGESHPSVARNLNNLAQLLKDTNRLVDAEPLMRRALQIVEHSYGDRHPLVATTLSNLAVLLMSTNRLGEAEPLMRRALEIDEECYGESHTKVAGDLNSLAHLLQDTNRLAEAEPLLRRALKIDEQSYGQKHPAVSRDLNNLAQLLQDTNRLKEAEFLMRRALEIDEESYGESHTKVARDLNNLGRLLQATDRLSEAEPLLRRAIEIDERFYGKHDPAVTFPLGNLASLLQATNRFKEAEPLDRRVVEILLTFSRDNGHPHPHLQLAVNKYAALLREIGRSEEEIQAALKALALPFGVDLG